MTRQAVGELLGTPGQEISGEQVSEIERLGLSYWWYAVRRAHVDAVFRRIAPAGELRFLDHGCGTGRLTEHWIERYSPQEALGIDGTRDAVELAARRGVPVKQIDLRMPLELPFAPNLITSLDVLEHLEDPVGALRNLAEASAANATLIVTVPAMPSLFSRWDELSGHYRRYTRPLLRAQLAESGWKPHSVRYIFSYCAPPAWLQRRVLRRVSEFEFPRVSSAANGALIFAGHLERWVGAPLPFGTSLLATATR